MEKKIDKTLTGISSEFFVAAELARRNFNVTLTLGNTKKIDLLIENEEIVIPIQVKGIHSPKSISWNLKLNTVKENIVYILVNLNAKEYEFPEFYIFNGKEIKKFIKIAKSGRDWINYNEVKKSSAFNNWELIEFYGVKNALNN